MGLLRGDKNNFEYNDKRRLSNIEWAINNMLINKHISLKTVSIIAIALTITALPLRGICQEYKSEKELQKAAENFFKEKNYHYSPHYSI